MPRRKRKTKAEDLARVRNNQRKSRERRKQYIKDLEQKVEQLEASKSSVSVPSLLSENQMLKDLLGSVGINDLSLERYLHGRTPGALPPPMGFVATDLAGSTSDMQFPFGLTSELSISAELVNFNIRPLDLDATIDSSLSFGDAGPFQSQQIQSYESTADATPTVVQDQAVLDDSWTVANNLLDGNP